MVLRCAWAVSRKTRRGRFIHFPTPKTDLAKCLRWIKACSRPHEQLNVSRINQHKVVCSKHFVGGNGPTKEFPDPVCADGSKCTPARNPPKESVRKQGGPDKSKT
ncbi:hypothetical protein KUTeg_021868 [Tegillarca granosa]|uniref:THAP-type domain-containing protein n=1 Tax=Tegillarca granosa TaxID=220873 RepID=A0ABQ9E4K6_TEGGR|nr:hypothetical protein KUTeg_021868 [Tegillarca granosa]